jgi:hypothetical protein
MPLRIFNERERLIEPHRLIVEYRRGERRQVITFQIGARISYQREACRVRFRKAVKREGTDSLHNFFLSFPGDSIQRQTLPQFSFNRLHASFRTFEAKSAAQLFSLTTGKPGTYHRHPQ